MSWRRMRRSWSQKIFRRDASRKKRHLNLPPRLHLPPLEWNRSGRGAAMVSAHSAEITDQRNLPPAGCRIRGDLNQTTVGFAVKLSVYLRPSPADGLGTVSLTPPLLVQPEARSVIGSRRMTRAFLV